MCLSAPKISVKKRSVNGPEMETEISQALPLAQEGQASKDSEGSALLLARDPPVGLGKYSQGWLHMLRAFPSLAVPGC